MKNVITDIIPEINSNLKAKYPDFCGVYYFGSRARGDHSLSSDYDLAFIFRRKINWKFEKEVIAQIYPFLIKYDIVIDPHIYSISEIDEPVTPFRINVKEQGIFYAV